MSQVEESAPEREELSDDAETLPWHGAPSLSAAIEALLIVAVEPMSTVDLAQAIGVPTNEVDEEVQRLSQEYLEQGRGFALREVAGGWRFYTGEGCADLLQHWVLDGQQARITQAALETLAVIAYRQPVSRARVSAVRGVNVDGVIRTLMSRGLIEEAGADPSSQAILYRTTAYFLERLGLASLDDLPDISEFLPDLAELDEVLDSVSAGE